MFDSNSREKKRASAWSCEVSARAARRRRAQARAARRTPRTLARWRVRAHWAWTAANCARAEGTRKGGIRRSLLEPPLNARGAGTAVAHVGGLRRDGVAGCACVLTPGARSSCENARVQDCVAGLGRCGQIRPDGAVRVGDLRRPGTPRAPRVPPPPPLDGRRLILLHCLCCALSVAVVRPDD